MKDNVVEDSSQRSSHIQPDTNTNVVLNNVVVCANPSFSAPVEVSGVRPLVFVPVGTAFKIGYRP